MEKIRIAIVDDQNLFRQSLAMMIANFPFLDLVAQAACGEDLFELLNTIPDLPQVLLLDMNLPGMNGIEINEKLRNSYPQIRVIVLSVHSQPRIIAKMIDAGAASYLAKNCDQAELIMAIKTVADTGFYMNQQTLIAIQTASAKRNKTPGGFSLPFDLTNRESEILTLICKQNGNAEIAEKLFLSIRTVEGHRNNLLVKTDSRNTAGLVLFAIKHELIDMI